MTGTRCLSPSFSPSLSLPFFLFLRAVRYGIRRKAMPHSVSRPVRWTRNRAASHGVQGETSFRAIAGNARQTHEPTQSRRNTRSRAERERTYSSRGSPWPLSPSSVCFTFSFFSCLSGTSFTPPSLSRDEKEPLEESTLLTGSRLPKIFPRRIIRGTSSLARLSPWSPLSWNLSVLQSELVVDAWNSSANDANRLDHPA